MKLRKLPEAVMAPIPIRTSGERLVTWWEYDADKPYELSVTIPDSPRVSKPGFATWILSRQLVLDFLEDPTRPVGIADVHIFRLPGKFWRGARVGITLTGRNRDKSIKKEMVYTMTCKLRHLGKFAAATIDLVRPGESEAEIVSNRLDDELGKILYGGDELDQN